MLDACIYTTKVAQNKTRINYGGNSGRQEGGPSTVKVLEICTVFLRDRSTRHNYVKLRLKFNAIFIKLLKYEERLWKN